MSNKNTMSAKATPATKPKRRQWWRWGLVVLLAGGLFCGLMVLTPRDYVRLLAHSQTELTAAGDRFETLALQLSNRVRVPGKWSAEFSEDEINGWLAVDLPEKFPGSVPAAIEQPRISIQDQKLILYFRYRVLGIQVPMTLATTASGTDTANQVSLQLDRAAVGWLPVPATWWARALSQSLDRSGYRAQWTQAQGRPAVQFVLPESLSRRDGNQWTVDAVGCAEKKLLFNGNTQKGLPSPQ